MASKDSKISSFAGVFLIAGSLLMLGTFIWYTMESGKEKAHQHTQAASVQNDEATSTLVALMEKLKEHPEDPAAHRELGLFFIAAEDWNRAEYFLKQSLAYDPYNASTLSFLGLAQYRMGDFGAAAMTLEMSLTHGKTPEALLNLAIIQAYKLDNPAKAKALLEELLALEDASARVKTTARAELEKLEHKEKNN